MSTSCGVRSYSQHARNDIEKPRNRGTTAMTKTKRTRTSDQPTPEIPETVETARDAAAVSVQKTPETTAGDPLFSPLPQFLQQPQQRAERAQARIAELEAQIAASQERSSKRAQNLAELEAALDEKI